VTLPVVVPARCPRDPAGNLDEKAIAGYASQLSATWVDYILVSGSAGGGQNLDADQRGRVLDLWLDVAPPGRLIAACWSRQDVAAALTRTVQPMIVLQDLPDRRVALQLLASLPVGAYVYSHPRYTTITLDPVLAHSAASAGVLPAGAKVSKVPTGDIAALRKACGLEFDLWHGSARDISGSIDAGASAVVVTALADLPDPFPPKGVAALQALVDAHAPGAASAAASSPAVSDPPSSQVSSATRASH
jgi:dihydrodipicolinate synthase/N-acetylneuraminate lyase